LSVRARVAPAKATVKILRVDEAFIVRFSRNDYDKPEHQSNWLSFEQCELGIRQKSRLTALGINTEHPD
jgi:hypothetical protein